MTTHSNSPAQGPAVHPMALSELEAHPAGPSVAPAMAALAQVKTRVTVVAGQAEASVGEILALQAGSVLPLEAAVNSPFDVVLNGATIARGELVAIGDRYGICITEVAKSS